MRRVPTPARQRTQPTPPSAKRHDNACCHLQSRGHKIDSHNRTWNCIARTRVVKYFLCKISTSRPDGPHRGLRPQPKSAVGRRQSAVTSKGRLHRPRPRRRPRLFILAHSAISSPLHSKSQARYGRLPGPGCGLRSLRAMLIRRDLMLPNGNMPKSRVCRHLGRLGRSDVDDRQHGGSGQPDQRSRSRGRRSPQVLAGTRARVIPERERDGRATGTPFAGSCVFRG